MKKGYVDFHLHTTHSDGKCSVEETIQAAQNEGLAAIAITDHNCFALEHPMKCEDLEVIPGAEFSTIYHYGNNKKTELHLVGLFFNGVDLSLNDMFQNINKMPYVKALVDKMNDLGNSMTLEEVIEHHKTNQNLKKEIGRHDVAEVLVKKGYSIGIEEAMDEWVGNLSPHCINPAEYIQYVDLEECVHRICDSPTHPGLPILAHPFFYRLSLEEIEELVAYYRSITDKPLGIEVYYRNYSDDTIAYLEQLAEKYHLLPSAASDRHRPVQPFKMGDYKLLEDMKKAMHI